MLRLSPRLLLLPWRKPILNRHMRSRHMLHHRSINSNNTPPTNTMQVQIDTRKRITLPPPLQASLPTTIRTTMLIVHTPRHTLHLTRLTNRTRPILVSRMDGCGLTSIDHTRPFELPAGGLVNNLLGSNDDLPFTCDISSTLHFMCSPSVITHCTSSRPLCNYNTLHPKFDHQFTPHLS